MLYQVPGVSQTMMTVQDYSDIALRYLTYIKRHPH